MLILMLAGIAVGLVSRGGVAAIPFLAAISLIPMQQRLVLAGLDFDVPRILILTGWVGLLARGEHRGLRLTPIDVALVTWLTVGTAIHLIRVPETQVVAYRAGVLLDGVGAHFLVRCLVRSREDLEKLIAAFSVLALVLAPFFLVEKFSSMNAFSWFGGLPAQSWLRDGTIRAQGPFAHPIMAGSYGATFLPLAVALALSGSRLRRLGWLACGAALVITVAAASSGAILALGVAILGWVLWPARRQIGLIRWIAAGVLLVLHFVREQPVWHLIGRVSDFVGGTGYHRFRLIDGFIANWSDWFLIGINSTEHWGWGLADLTNQFVVEGVRGGILTFLAFLALLTSTFMCVGEVSRRARRARWLETSDRRALEIWGWALGVSLATHCTSWLSVSYFGQMQAVLHVHLALGASLLGVYWRARSARQRHRADGSALAIEE